MTFAWDFPYPSQRMPVMARNVVATSQPLASSAGLRALQDGGNAVDAALAAAITLTVVEPTMNGIGGDLFAIVHANGAMHGLNASGRSPAAWTPELFAGSKDMPKLGWNTVTVPGAVSGWIALSRKFGRLPFKKLFESAIGYAENGFVVSPRTAVLWQKVPTLYKNFSEMQRVFTIDGRAPRAGELFRCLEHAKTLQAIADSDGEDFYRGDLAERIAAASASEGGKLTREDLAAHHADWVEPLSKEFRGFHVHEIPPNGQGMAAQVALGILAHTAYLDFQSDSADAQHVMIEAMKLAFADIHHHVADPAHMAIDPRRLLDEAYLKRRAALIDRKRATFPTTGVPRKGGTVYLCAADADGMMVSLIQSNYCGFGSGVVIPGTGISMQNRGLGFSLEPGHPNQVGPRKRPFHTIIPGFITDAKNQPWAAFGVMGGQMQPQGHLQVVARMLGYNQNPQTAIDAPRWCVLENGRDLMIEHGFPADIRAELARRGHRLVDPVTANMGGAQMIVKLESGYLGASDPRKDGQAVGF
jgi:gamma-glutamyltranspeptidase/glutathione hydrolase